MSLALMVSPPWFAAVRPEAANKRPPSQAPRKTQRQKPATTTSHGFGGKKKDPVWQCVQNCGACCKLDKGPNFPSPDEIFDNPSDIQSVHIFAELSQRFLIRYMGLTRRSSTRKHAVAV